MVGDMPAPVAQEGASTRKGVACRRVWITGKRIGRVPRY